jgi:chromate transporter
VTGAAEVFVAFLRLGLTSFGGPVAHLGYFRRAFVERRRWLNETEYAELVALCQFLPGPTSSQVGFLIGKRRAGWTGAAAAWLGFTAPSAALMTAAAFGVTIFSTRWGGALAHGLQLVAAAVVAQAVFSMARPLRDVQWIFAALAGAILMLTSVAWLQPALIAISAVLGAFILAAPAPADKPAGRVRWGVPLGIAVFVMTLAYIAPSLVAFTPQWSVAAICFHAGAFVFGGGHVVLPLLEADIAGRGWLSKSDFLAGYGAAQVMPGPLFTFAAFLGAAAKPCGGVPGAVAALMAIFAPGLILAVAGETVWGSLQASSAARGAARGATGAVVGVLAAALFTNVLTTSVRTPIDGGLALAGFLAIEAFKVPVWFVAPCLAVLGAVTAFAAA